MSLPDELKKSIVLITSRGSMYLYFSALYRIEQGMLYVDTGSFRSAMDAAGTVELYSAKNRYLASFDTWEEAVAWLDVL